MAWLEGAIRKEVARHRTAMARYDGVCNHIAVSDGASLFGYFNEPGNPTSHFYVRKSSATPGATMADFEQYVDTRYRAPANLQGNPRLISIETQGGVGADLNNGWTPLQVERLAWILAECHRLHGIPLIAMPNSLPSTRGLGYHRLGIDPWRVDGGELWSNSYGKVCPGSARIAQQGIILARARTIASGDTGSGGPIVEEPLTPEEIAAVATASAKAVWDELIARDADTGPVDTPARTVMFRLNTGPVGLPAMVRDWPWKKSTTSAVDSTAVDVLNLLRYAQGDSRAAAALLGTGGAINEQLDAMHTILVNEDAQTDRIETAVTTPLDPATIAGIAAAVVAAMPPDEPVSQAALEAALRNVLGSLDG